MRRKADDREKKPRSLSGKNSRTRKSGRPTKFTQKHLSKAAKIAAAGLTDKNIADYFSVTVQTINNWKAMFPEFFESLKRGKEMADGKVEAALYHRALGYSVPDMHITNYQGVITATPIIKHYPPDVTACIFWLKNRKPKEWKDRQELGFSDETIKIAGRICGMSEEELEKIVNAS